MNDPWLCAPFPYPGRKSRVAHVVWDALGDVDNYVEPFAGSLAVLLARPGWHKRRAETVNDLNGYIANFWRAVKLRPGETAKWADYPTSHVDQAARHWWLNQQRDLLDEMLSDPLWCDPQIAGWWVWGISTWIGSGWCDGTAQRPDLGNAGQGVPAKRPHLGDAGQGTQRAANLHHWFRILSERLANVRIIHGDWTRMLRGALKYGATRGVFLDPPYTPHTLAGDADLYAGHHGSTVAADAAAWAVQAADEHGYRIVLAGYAEEHDMPDDWTEIQWSSRGMQTTKASKSYQTRHKERLWLSPACLHHHQHQLI